MNAQWENPAGTDGFEFVEYTAPDTAALHALFWGPVLHGGTLPLVYLAGIYALAMVYSLYYVIFQDEDSLVWLYGVLFVFFYLAIMLWQTYYAIAPCRTSKWGTRMTPEVGLAGGGGEL